MRKFALGALGALIVAAQASGAALAQDQIEAFYKGKQISLVVGAPPGGGYDFYARLVARHMPRFIPGAPAVIVRNMPGGGGNTTGAHIANAAPKDGTAIGALQAGNVTDQLTSQHAAQIRHDARKFQYIGSASSEVFVCVVDAASPVQRLEDLREREVLLGSGGGTTGDMPMAMKNILGLKIKLVAGYAGTRDITLAVDRKEVQGFCGFGWNSLKSMRPDWVDKGQVRILAQESMVGDPDLNKRGIPLSVSLATSAEQRQMFELLYSQGIYTRPFVMAEEVPADRVAAIRAAFMKALADPQLLEEAAKQSLVVTAISGVEMQDAVKKLYETPAAAIEKLKQAIALEK